VEWLELERDRRPGICATGGRAVTRRADTQRELELPTAWSDQLSTEQLRFFFLHEMNPRDPDVYICRTLRITGRLDHDVLRASVLDMASRHDILRSYYPDVDDQPQIWLRDEVEDAVVTIDLSRLPSDERERRADELITDELQIRDPLSIEQGPLFRVTAVKLDHDEHVVIFRFHHIVVDGTSVRMFMPKGAVIQQLALNLVINQHISSLYSVFDPHIPETSHLEGAENVVLPTIGHFRPVGDALTLETIDRILARLTRDQAA